MSYELRVAAGVQLAALVLLGVYSWEAIAVLGPLRWPFSALVWLAPFFWLLRSRDLAVATRLLPLTALLLWWSWYLMAANWSPDQRPAVAFSLGVLSTILGGFWFTATFGWLRFARVAAVVIGGFLVAGVLYRVAEGSLLQNGRFAGIGNNPTDTGRHAAVMAVLGWGGFAGRKRWQAVFIVGGLGFAALAIAKTALIGVVAAAGFLSYRSSLRYQRPRLLAAAATSFVIIVTFISLATGAAEPTIDSEGTPSALTLTGRTQVWYFALDAIADRPIMGHGTGSSNEVLGRLIASGNLSWQATNAHNLWLQSLLEHGLLGLSLLIVAFGVLVSRCRARPEPSRDATLVLLAVNSMTETLVQYPGLSLLVVAAAAGSMAPDWFPTVADHSPRLFKVAQ